MSSIFTKAIRYGLHEELDELYEFIAEMVADTENIEAEQGDYPDDSYPAELQRLFSIIEGRVAVLDATGGHEHGDPGELDSKGGFR